LPFIEGPRGEKFRWRPVAAEATNGSQLQTRTLLGDIGSYRQHPFRGRPQPRTAVICPRFRPGRRRQAIPFAARVLQGQAGREPVKDQELQIFFCAFFVDNEIALGAELKR